MNCINLYAVILSEATTHVDNPDQWAAFFTAASVIIIVIMLGFVWYFDIIACGLLMERCFTPLQSLVIRLLRTAAVKAGIRNEDETACENMELKVVENLPLTPVENLSRGMSSNAREVDQSPVQCQWVVGTRVVHPERGGGRILVIDLEDQRDRPIHVRFDSGEVHHYSLAAAGAKLQQDARPHGPPGLTGDPSEPSIPSAQCQWMAGTRVVHSDRGEGLIVKITFEDPRDRPIHVRFDSGELHHYTLASAATKLEPAGQTKTTTSGQNSSEQTSADSKTDPTKQESKSTACAHPPFNAVLFAGRDNQTGEALPLPDAHQLRRALGPDEDLFIIMWV